MVASSDRSAVTFSLSSGNAHDAPEGRKLLSARVVLMVFSWLWTEHMKAMRQEQLL